MEQSIFLEKIESLEIQGATAVARETLRFAAEHVPETGAAEFVDALRRDVLSIRPTEPMLDNATDIAVTRIEQGGDAATVLHELGAYIDAVNETIVDKCVEDVFDGSVHTVLTHCHSSTAEDLIIAGSERSDLSVYATETRPKYQGRTTAQNLVTHGVDTTMIVDSAVFSMLDTVDAVIVGADALTANHVFNKIGTSQIAYLAAKQDIDFYVAASLLKYTEDEPVVEQRDADEVWKKRPAELNVLNPAFDSAPLTQVTGLCTERGVVDTDAVAAEAAAYQSSL